MILGKKAKEIQALDGKKGGEPFTNTFPSTENQAHGLRLMAGTGAVGLQERVVSLN